MGSHFETHYEWWGTEGTRWGKVPRFAGILFDFAGQRDVCRGRG